MRISLVDIERTRVCSKAIRRSVSRTARRTWRLLEKRMYGFRDAGVNREFEIKGASTRKTQPVPLQSSSQKCPSCDTHGDKRSAFCSRSSGLVLCHTVQRTGMF